ncbi:3-hydroxyacyl-CoA dehydrogenase family protein [Streptomyces sp. NBC_00091]|uniref:3-hydroxyacyl-CoA dehydrogenase family protein n=1 Tax=Streptomyces sp. NBC_00091 TaxID=2975648 RepID=UPI002254ADBB|nr:3-hydroxyacyl-CoA dehydrogenase NAD-binding domain-containing protein [Streptomyces sp. NBC_00091]MCX5381192.1 3-hydroxyacyl-CoA dehydrogenase NAD-binding domain-containing protein [Streptomyces sp. NBC_00091]
MSQSPHRTVTVIGAGTIGLGWITLFLEYGLHVRVNSRRPDAPRIVTEALRRCAAHLPEGADGRLGFEPDLERAVERADVVVESVPEDLEVKQALFARVGEAARAEALLLSSTSALHPDSLGARMADSGRLVVAHPFDPPYVVPLVELVPGELTAPEAVREAVAFFESLGRVPVVLRRPIPAFAAARLQSALLRESVYLVREGVVSAEELDRVVTHCVGPRWAAAGPFLASRLDRERPPLDEAVRAFLGEQAERAYGAVSREAQLRERDARQARVVRALPQDTP